MFENTRRSLELAKTSWKVLQANKEFYTFPVRSMLVIILFTCIFVVPLSYFNLLPWFHKHHLDLIVFLLMIVYCFVTYSLILYFNTALACAVLVHLRGGVPTIYDAFRIANDRLHYIIQYAIIVTIVGGFLGWLQDRGVAGTLASKASSFAFELATFFVIPILVVENINPTDAIDLSTQLLKKTWGEQIIGNISINSVFMLMILVTILISIPACAYLQSISPYLAVILGIIASFSVVALTVVNTALSEIFVVVLYEYASGNTESMYFKNVQIMQAFKEVDQ